MRNLWLIIFFATLAWSAIYPKDNVTWLLEVMPALFGFVVLLATRRKFPLTSLAYVLILFHCVILMVGGHYTYAEVPLFDWIRDWFGQERNNYDKVGHFVQGFVPAIIAREILVRNAIVAGRGWLAFIVVCICLAISACYELIEWWVAIWSGASAEAFLGTQGYLWDTQSDMLYALIGAIAALLLLSGRHDRQIGQIAKRGTRDAV
jgi:putative membrane protein